MDACKVCSHPRIDDIHRALDEGKGQNATATAFGVAATTLKRHIKHRAAPPTERKCGPEGRPEPPADVHRLMRRRGGQCAVCTYPFADEIEAALLRGEAAQALERAHADRGGPRADSIRGHGERCIPELLREARDHRIAALVDEAVTVARELVTEGRDLVKDAKGKGTLRERAVSLSSACRALDLLGHITGEIGPDVEVKILELPQWGLLQERILVALRPFPDARRAVMEAMRSVEQGAPPALPEGA